MTRRDDFGRAGRRAAAAAVATVALLAAGCGDDSDGDDRSPAEVMAEGRPTDDVVEDLDSMAFEAGWEAGGQNWDDCEDGGVLTQWRATDPDTGEEIVGWGFSGDVWHVGEASEEVVLGDCYGHDDYMETDP